MDVLHAEAVQILTSYHHILEFFNKNVYFVKSEKKVKEQKQKLIQVATTSCESKIKEYVMSPLRIVL